MGDMKVLNIFQAHITLLALFELTNAFWTPDEEVKDTVISIQIGGTDIIIPDFDETQKNSSQWQRPNKEATEKPSPRNDKSENSQHLWRSSGPNHFFEIFSPSTEVELQGKGLFSQHLTDDPLFKSRRTLERFQNSEQAKTVKEERIIKSQLNKNEKKRKSSSSPFQDKLDLKKLRTTLRPSYHTLEKLKTIKKARQ